jgi:hypothetical protein
MASYLLNDGAEWFIYVGDTYGDWTLYVDDQEAQIASDAVRSRWYVTDHRPEQMELRHAPLSRAVAYRLPEGTQIEGLARELSADEFKEQFPRDEDYDYIDARGKLYEAVTESYVPDPKPVETPVLVLEGRPPDRDDTREWVAKLPYELRHRPEYLHLFPGYLVGFEKALVAALEQVPGVSSAHESRPSEPVKVFYNLRYWPKPHRGRTLNGRRKDFQSVLAAQWAPDETLIIDTQQGTTLLNGEHYVQHVNDWPSFERGRRRARRRRPPVQDGRHRHDRRRLALRRRHCAGKNAVLATATEDYNRSAKTAEGTFRQTSASCSRPTSACGSSRTPRQQDDNITRYTAKLDKRVLTYVQGACEVVLLAESLGNGVRGRAHRADREVRGRVRIPLPEPMDLDARALYAAMQRGLKTQPAAAAPDRDDENEKVAA